MADSGGGLPAPKSKSTTTATATITGTTTTAATTIATNPRSSRPTAASGTFKLV